MSHMLTRHHPRVLQLSSPPRPQLSLDLRRLPLISFLFLSLPEFTTEALRHGHQRLGLRRAAFLVSRLCTQCCYVITIQRVGYSTLVTHGIFLRPYFKSESPISTSKQANSVATSKPTRLAIGNRNVDEIAFEAKKNRNRIIRTMKKNYTDDLWSLVDLV
ncbi:hypothetical protein M422DRAFT_243007 [Sphaerobolus stellatus SS14]|nr:hypothetical protein M422DRAFT_243007 [Sphaerobolus stellatus SS14]